jgi:hypothetical protein
MGIYGVSEGSAEHLRGDRWRGQAVQAAFFAATHLRAGKVNAHRRPFAAPAAETAASAMPAMANGLLSLEPAQRLLMPRNGPKTATARTIKLHRKVPPKLGAFPSISN